MTIAAGCAATVALTVILALLTGLPMVGTGPVAVLVVTGAWWLLCR